MFTNLRRFFMHPLSFWVLYFCGLFAVGVFLPIALFGFWVGAAKLLSMLG